jgi:hypothetical protein
LLQDKSRFPARLRLAARCGADQSDLVLSMSFASDTPYERWWGIEILDCQPESVRLDRLNDGAAILYNHNWDDLRGHHVPGSVVADGHVGARRRGHHPGPATTAKPSP